MKQFEEILKKSQPELQKFADLVLKWQQTVNLIAPSTMPNIWERHVIDSAQLVMYIPTDAKVLVDMGSGGGFPAIVLAIINKVIGGSLEQFYLVESDVKKSIFLREVARVFDLPVQVINKRLENVIMENVDVVTARALKTVEELFVLGQGFITEKTICLFLKGERVDEELAQNTHKCCIEKIPSCTHKKSYILKIGGVQYE
ncbi:MAG: 16S rRNA (guanine(527)-N(7))-methyltransferase RsmG [Alphaproteobacteria bacterium]|nr:16S rRNA (guanine(527)-N(7))-methyltransferase RsmG [Alphaproteobacteria bacterium]